MKKIIPVVILIIALVGSLVGFGVSLYCVHFGVWSSPSNFIFLIPSLGGAILLLGLAIVIFFGLDSSLWQKIVIYVALPVVIIGGFFLDLGIENLSFNIYTSFAPEKWLTIESKYKLEMANDFLSKYEVKGMKMNEIVSLLGEPAEEGEVESSEEYSYRYSYDCGRPIKRYALSSYRLDFFANGDNRDLEVVAYSLEEYRPA